MKTKLLAFAVIASLAACAEPIPQNGWVQNSVDMKQVPGLEDCKYLSVRTTTGSNPIHVIRCPMSSVSAEWTVQSGKSSTSVRSVTVDENRVRELEQQLNDATAAQARIAEQLQAAKAGR